MSKEKIHRDKGKSRRFLFPSIERVSRSSTINTAGFAFLRSGVHVDLTLGQSTPAYCKERAWYSPYSRNTLKTFHNITTTALGVCYIIRHDTPRCRLMFVLPDRTTPKQRSTSGRTVDERFQNLITTQYSPVTVALASIDDPFIGSQLGRSYKEAEIRSPV